MEPDSEQGSDTHAVGEVLGGSAVDLMHRLDLGPRAAPLREPGDGDAGGGVRRRAGPLDPQRSAFDFGDREADGARHLRERQLVVEHERATVHREPEVTGRREIGLVLGGVEADPRRRQRLPVHGQHVVLVAHRGGNPGRGVPTEPVHHERGPARQVPVDRHLPRPGLVRRGEVVAPARAGEREHEVGAGAAMRPDAGGAMLLEADPLVVVRVRDDGGRGLDAGGNVRERRRGPRDLAEQVEGELQSAFGPAVAVLVPMAMGVRHPVAVEAGRERAGRVHGPPQPHPVALLGEPFGDRERRELERQCRTERAGGPTPGDRRAVPRPDREHEVEGRRACPPPTASRVARRVARRRARRPRCRCRSGRRDGSSRRGSGGGSRPAPPRPVATSASNRAGSSSRPSRSRPSAQRASTAA